MAKPCRCKKPGECEECPEWIFTFADLVMLMMGFFVILWVLKPNPGKNGKADDQSQEKFEDALIAIKMEFGWKPDPSGNDPLSKRALGTVPRVGNNSGKDAGPPTPGVKGVDPAVQTIRPGKWTTVGSRIMFSTGSDELSSTEQKALVGIADRVRGHYNIVRVRGHASLDDFPNEGDADQRMALSIKRAQAIRLSLIQLGVAEDTIEVVGRSSHEPVRQHQYGPNAQAENRRVEVEVSESLVEERQGRGKTVDNGKQAESSQPPACGFVPRIV